MINKYIIPVDGLPPKKHSENSMWTLKNERIRLINLRNIAKMKLGENKPLKHEIEIYLKIFVKNLKEGDLDNFVAGICDGLMKPHDKTGFSKIPSEDLDKINRNFSLIEEDLNVIKIKAIKKIGIHQKYKLIIKGKI